MIFTLIRDFIRENRGGIRIAFAVVLMIAGILVVASHHVLLGIAIIAVGLVMVALAVGRLLGSSDYSDGRNLNIKGMGQQQSSLNKKPTSTVANEITPDIWNQMTNEKSEN